MRNRPAKSLFGNVYLDDMSVLKAAALNAELAGKGYVIVPFLNPDEVAALKALFHEEMPATPDGFYATTHEQDAGFKQRISKAIHAILKRGFEEHLGQATPLGGALISKAPGEKSILPLHQDWNIVDESRFRSYNVWIPLVDVNEFNGVVQVLEGSHDKEQTFRGPNLMPTLQGVSIAVLQEMKSLPMTAGQALIYDHALWHASPVNQSDELRLAAVFGVIPEQANMQFYYQDGNEVVEYASNPEFFLSGNPQEGPAGLTETRRIPHVVKAHNEAAFRQIYLGEEHVPEPVKPKKKSIFNIFRR